MIVDTGPLYAAADSSDQHHQACSLLFRHANEPLIAPAPVLVEVCQLIGARMGPTREAQFVRDLVASSVKIELSTPGDLRRAAQLIEKYHDLNIGVVDALVIATAERLGERKVATVDHRHFRVVHPSHVDAFELLP